MDRRRFLALTSPLLVAPLPAYAQPSSGLRRVGYLGTSSPTLEPQYVDAFRQQLRQLGYVEDQHVVIDYRWAEGRDDRLPDLAVQLVRLKPDVMVTTGTPGTLAAMQATKTIPIVMVSFEQQPVAGEPAGETKKRESNLTGITTFAPELAARRLDLLREVVPKLARAAVLWRSTGASATADLRATQAAASARAVALTPVETTSDADIRSALAEIGKLRPEGLIVLADAVALAQRQRLATFASRSKLPAVFPSRDYVDAGGLLAYGANWAEVFRQAATLVDQILRGAKPANLGVRHADRLELVVNLRAARALPVTVPSSLLQRADRVLE